jgi:hypothetical protein
MMNDISPQIGLLIVLLIFFVLWYFYGGDNEYSFVGLQPLYPEYELGEETTLETTLQKDSVIDINEMSVHPKDEFEEDTLLPEKITDVNFSIDLTPALPDIFTDDITYEKKEGGRFESRGENICRQVLEKIYGVKFPNVRPTFLKNIETGRLLELDAYNEDLKLAIEYNGPLHYRFNCNGTTLTYNEFKKQVARDKLKKKLCIENGVHLITIPHNVPLEKLPLYIVYHLPPSIRQRALDEKIIENL